MAKFSNAKVGDRAFDILRGWGTIIAIKLNQEYPIYFNADIDSFCTFTLDGKRDKIDKNPTLFWNEVKLPTEEEDKKPFDLVEFLRENLEPKEFLLEEHNNTINYSHRDGRFFYNYTIYLDRITEIYFKNSKYEIVEVVQVLNENNITPQQLKQAYKILNWF